MAASVGSFIFYGTLAQAGWAGMSSSMEVANSFQDAEQACKDNVSMTRLADELQIAMSQGLTTTLELRHIQEIIGGWHETWLNLEGWASRLRKQFLHQYVFFLGALGFVTMALFFAVEKKAGRLHKLLHKISRIVHAEAVDNASS